MKRTRRFTLVLLTALLCVPASLSADGPCETECINAATDLIAFAGWELERAYQLMQTCIKGCSVPDANAAQP